MTGINEVAKEIHENARAHGWWDEERGFPEVLALIHSEVSEALEEYRNGHGATEIYFSDSGKPEGIPTELADVIIRVLDYCGYAGIDIDALEAATSGLQGIKAFCTANAIKYLWRWKLKNGEEDLQKAVWYINRLIQRAAQTAPQERSYSI